ncbi:MAG: alpha-1,4-glucan--maltose-1-phosphate maltosyltransferase [Pseudonocardiales bacterium]|nr:alpha-1,4-glucan--maltose-1-phosphate maltosyltransferase [Pseudonocardiales bacterium]MBV9652521.1 alpha-1,4-glucan--maltose-1-phosphate maltosyltransferase [Pseudonocardiales bacterium]
MSGRIAIDDVTPTVSCGKYPSKAVVGEQLPVHAAVWREGHDAVGATVVWRGPGTSVVRHVRMQPGPPGTDRFVATVVPDRVGWWVFRVDGWADPWESWRHAIEAKIAAGQTEAELLNDLITGARLLERAARRPGQQADRVPLSAAAAALRATGRPLEERVGPALSPLVAQILMIDPLRDLITKGTSHKVWVDRPQALFSSWYEFFPRSTGGWDADGNPVHGTFATASRELDRIAGMGFDVVYLPPIHPIGEVNRKGPNNTTPAGPDDPGSPWAIGSVEGGHDAVHPQLGMLADFEAFVARARELGMEVALDFALQCAPDHPWAKEHQEWFTIRPDGSIAYAENPPKRYQDIYPLNFDADQPGIYQEMLRVMLFWVERGVRIFRVDNPHTKPPDFWQWLIWRVKDQYPDVLFLSEAFTRPARLYGLARLGFTQSYTYFTWRTSKQEITEYATELVSRLDECRPNFFVNTPDILHASLQYGGPGMFAIRAALAATLSPSWGVYSGFELYERTPVRPGSEEYLDSEKYQLRPRDFAAALAEGRSLEPWITRLNEIRRAHPALQQMRTLQFHQVDNDALLAYSKTDPASGDIVICVVTLDPFTTVSGTVLLDLPALGLDSSDHFDVHDEVSGETYHWGPTNFVQLQPWLAVAHILRVAAPAP